MTNYQKELLNYLNYLFSRTLDKFAHLEIIQNRLEVGLETHTIADFDKEITSDLIYKLDNYVQKLNELQEIESELNKEVDKLFSVESKRQASINRILKSN